MLANEYTNCFLTYSRIITCFKHSSSSGGAPFNEQPFWTVLCPLSYAELRPWLSGWRSSSMVQSQVHLGRPLGRCQYARRWLIADVRASGWMILWWVSSDNVTEKTETPRRNERGNWILIGPAPYFLVGDVSRIYGIRKILRRHHWSKAHRYTSTWFFRHTPCILNINQSINQINLYSAPYKRGRRRLTIITCKCKSIA